MCESSMSALSDLWNSRSWAPITETQTHLCSPIRPYPLTGQLSRFDLYLFPFQPFPSLFIWPARSEPRRREHKLLKAPEYCFSSSFHKPETNAGITITLVLLTIRLKQKLAGNPGNKCTGRQWKGLCEMEMRRLLATLKHFWLQRDIHGAESCFCSLQPPMTRQHTYSSSFQAAELLHVNVSLHTLGRVGKETGMLSCTTSCCKYFMIIMTSRAFCTNNLNLLHALAHYFRSCCCRLISCTAFSQFNTLHDV